MKLGFVLFGCFAGLGVPAANAGTLTLVDAAAFVSTVIQQTPTDNFARDVDTSDLAANQTVVRPGDSFPVTVSSATGLIVSEEEEEPPLFIASASAAASLDAGTIGMASDAEAFSDDNGLLAGGFSFFQYGFQYTGTEDLVLPGGWLSWSVDGTWGSDSLDGRAAAGAGLVAETSDVGVRTVDDEGRIFGTARDAVVSAGANGRRVLFSGSPSAFLLGVGDTTPSGAVTVDAFDFSIEAPSITVRDGQFLSIYMSHGLDMGVFQGSGFTDGLSTAQFGLNVLGLVEVETSLIGADTPGWLRDAPVIPEEPGGDTSVIPLPPAGLLLLAGLSGLAVVGRHRTSPRS